MCFCASKSQNGEGCKGICRERLRGKRLFAQQSTEQSTLNSLKLLSKKGFEKAMAVSKKRALPREKPETVRREFWVEIHRRAMLGVPKTSGLAADTPPRY